jgi:hypothetical protein
MLFELPPELRNRIYELVIRESHHIAICKNHKPHPPDCLNACKQLRSEALKVWYQFNHFRIVIEHFDTSFLPLWADHIQTVGVQPRCKISVARSYNWTNLREWCKHVHQDPSSQPFYTWNNGRESDTVARKTITIARECRGQPWSNCERALQALKGAMALYKKEWRQAG